jgi:hypothetical protein
MDGSRVTARTACPRAPDQPARMSVLILPARGLDARFVIPCDSSAVHGNTRDPPADRIDSIVFLRSLTGLRRGPMATGGITSMTSLPPGRKGPVGSAARRRSPRRLSAGRGALLGGSAAVASAARRRSPRRLSAGRGARSRARRLTIWWAIRPAKASPVASPRSRGACHRSGDRSRARHLVDRPSGRWPSTARVSRQAFRRSY